jgi:hypothetical protein
VANKGGEQRGHDQFGSSPWSGRAAATRGAQQRRLAGSTEGGRRADRPAGPSGLIGHWAGARVKREGAQ